MGFYIIVAADENNAIGFQNNLLVHLPDDLKRFKQLTIGNTVIMGRKTYESLPVKPLPKRRNIVLTRNKDLVLPSVEIATGLDKFFAMIKPDEEVFVIGGEQIYRLFLPYVTRIYLTRIHHTFTNADTFFPVDDFSSWKKLDEEFHPADEKHAYPFTFFVYEKVANNQNDKNVEL